MIRDLLAILIRSPFSDGNLPWFYPHGPIPNPTEQDPTTADTPPQGIPTPKAIGDIRVDLLRSLAALDLTREAAVTYREAGNGAADAEALKRASRILGDPEYLRQEVAKRLNDSRWLLPLLDDIRPKT